MPEIARVTVTADCCLYSYSLSERRCVRGLVEARQETRAGHQILPPERLARHLVAPPRRPP